MLNSDGLVHGNSEWFFLACENTWHKFAFCDSYNKHMVSKTDGKLQKLFNFLGSIQWVHLTLTCHLTVCMVNLGEYCW